MSSQQRASDFLKAWQDAMAKQLKDGDALKAMLAAMQAFGGGAHDAAPRRPAAAHDAGNDAIRTLTQRVWQLERDVARLTAQLDAVAAKTQKPAGAKRRRVAKPVAKRKRAVAKPKPKSKRKKR